MKFIVDAQLPKTLADYLQSKNFDAIHTLDLPKGNATKDSEIVKLSKKEKRIVISKDNDFLESIIIKDEPEKLIIISTGNIINKDLIKLIDKNLNKIIELIKNHRILEINRLSIHVHI